MQVEPGWWQLFQTASQLSLTRLPHNRPAHKTSPDHLCKVLAVAEVLRDVYHLALHAVYKLVCSFCASQELTL